MICTNNRTYEYEFGRSNHWTTRALALVKSEFYYTSRVYYTSVLGAERKRKARERQRSFHSCGGAETISGGYSFIHNDWDVGNEQSGENESRSTLASARSFSRGEIPAMIFLNDGIWKVASSILAWGTKIFVAPGEHGFSFFQVKMFTGSVSVLFSSAHFKK